MWWPRWQHTLLERFVAPFFMFLSATLAEAYQGPKSAVLPFNLSPSAHGTTLESIVRRCTAASIAHFTLMFSLSSYSPNSLSLYSTNSVFVLSKLSLTEFFNLSFPQCRYRVNSLHIRKLAGLRRDIYQFICAELYSSSNSTFSWSDELKLVPPLRLFSRVSL